MEQMEANNDTISTRTAKINQRNLIVSVILTIFYTSMYLILI